MLVTRTCKLDVQSNKSIPSIGHTLFNCTEYITFRKDHLRNVRADNLYQRNSIKPLYKFLIAANLLRSL